MERPLRTAAGRILRVGRRVDWKQTFACLKYPNFRLWFWGQMTSLFGSWMQVTAQGFLLYQLTKSPVYLGLLGFANGVPTWLFMLYAGAVADRVSRRRLLIITQTAMMVLAFILAFLTFTHLVRPWHILLLSVGMGIANAFDAPARQAFVLEMIDIKDLTNAIALNGAMFNMATALGPAVAGITYALFGPGWCFVINGISFIAVIAALAAMSLKPVILPSERRSILLDIREGLVYARRHSIIRILIATIGVITVFSLSFATLMPAWAVKILKGGATTNGLLHSARGAGALLGALMIAGLAGKPIKGKLLTLGLFAFPGLLIVFTFIRWLPGSLAVLFAAGVAQIFIFNLCNTLVQTHVEHRLRGRVMGIYSFVFFGMFPLGALGIGAAASRFGEAFAILMGTSITLLYAAALWIFMPRLRKMP